MKNKILLSFSVVLIMLFIVPVQANAQVLQLLPWSNGLQKAAYRMVTNGTPGFQGYCEDGHTDPMNGKVDFGLSSSDQVLAAEGGEVINKVTNCVVGAKSCNQYWGNDPNYYAGLKFGHQLPKFFPACIAG